MIRKIKLVTITVRDQQRSLEFFRDKVGMKVLADDPQADGGRWIELVTADGGSGIALVAADKGDRVGCFTNVIFGCDNVLNSFRDLQSRGVDFVTEPAEASWGTFAIFKDPDGNSFVIAS